MIRDNIVIGTNSNKLRKKLLETEHLDLKKAIGMARALELVEKHASDMSRHDSTHQAVDAFKTGSKKFGNATNTNKSTVSKQKDGRRINCKFCKTQHEYEKCPAFGKKCKIVEK